MKTSHLVSTLIAATCVSANSGRFYANISGILTPTTTAVHGTFSALTIWKPHLPLSPKYDFTNGTISTGNHDGDDFFGIAYDQLIFAKNDQVKPLKVKLDDNFKVVNIQPHSCSFPGGDYGPFFATNPQFYKFTTCTPVDIHFSHSAGK